MLRKIFYITSVITLLVMVLPSSLPGLHSIAPNVYASGYNQTCSSLKSNTTKYAACEYCNSSSTTDENSNGWEGCFVGYNSEVVDKGQNETQAYNKANFSDNEYAYFDKGWTGAKNPTQPGSPGASLSAEIALICGGYSQSQYDSCKQAVENESNKEPEQQACIGASDQSVCKTSWTIASGRQNPIAASAAAEQNCIPYAGNTLIACETGYMSGANNDPDDSICNDYTGSTKTVCQKAWTAGNATLTSGGGTGGTGGTCSTGAGTESDACGEAECEDGGYAFGWALCKIIDGVTAGVSDIYNDFVAPELITPSVDLSAGSSTHTFEIWSGFRVYGDIFLIIALLIIVIVESAGGGLIDAYSIRKILPRILLCGVLVNVSIYLVAAAVDITNVLGGSVSDLLYAPFKNDGGLNFVINPGAAHAGDYIAGGSIALVVWELFRHIHSSGAGSTIKGVGSLAASSLEYLFVTFMIPAFFIMLAIMGTLVFRRGLILFLIFVSPFAFALYCLPNTEKYFRQWWDLLFKALLIYPIIAILFTMGNILSVTISSSYAHCAPSASDATCNAATGGVADTLGLIALFVPLFLIPFSFKIAGGLLGRFHEFATGAATRGHQGILGDQKDPDSLRNRAKRNFASNRNNMGLSSRELMTRAGKGFVGKRARSAGMGIREAQRARFGAQFAESDLLHQANSKNDQYLLAHVRKDLAKQKRDDARAAGNTTEAAAWDQAISAASSAPQTASAKMASLQALAATGFQFSQGQKGYDELAETAAQLTGAQLQYQTGADGLDHVVGATGTGAGAFANAMNSAQYGLRTAGRYDLGGINNGEGYDPKAGTDKASLYELANAKPQSIDAFMEGKNSVEDQAIAYQELKAMLPSAKGATQDKIREHIQTLESGGIEASLQRAAPGSGMNTRYERESFDNNNPDHVGVPGDPTRPGWSSEDRTRGWKNRPVATATPEKSLESWSRENARTYERPNPEHMQS